MSQQFVTCIGCDGTGNNAVFSDRRCVLCNGRKVLPADELTCIKCGHLQKSHNGDYSFTGDPNECSIEISDEGTTCGCIPGTDDPYVTIAQRITEIQEQKKERREKLIKENKALYD